jgi:hypothetical protein
MSLLGKDNVIGLKGVITKVPFKQFSASLLLNPEISGRKFV